MWVAPGHPDRLTSVVNAVHHVGATRLLVSSAPPSLSGVTTVPEYPHSMVESSRTNWASLIAICVGVFLGTLLWGIFSPYPDDDFRDWVGLFIADTLGVVTLVVAWRYLRRDQQPPPT